MNNMFGDMNLNKKEPEPVKQQPPQPPKNNESNTFALFGTGPSGQKPDPTIGKSPQTRKQMKFNFEDAWKAE